MVVLVALTVGLVFWVTAWAFGIKAFDAFLLTVLLVVSAAACGDDQALRGQLLGRGDASSETP